jgi:hypothetical protein
VNDLIALLRRGVGAIEIQKVIAASRPALGVKQIDKLEFTKTSGMELPTRVFGREKHEYRTHNLY